MATAADRSSIVSTASLVRISQPIFMTQPRELKTFCAKSLQAGSSLECFLMEHRAVLLLKFINYDCCIRFGIHVVIVCKNLLPVTFAVDLALLISGRCAVD